MKAEFRGACLEVAKPTVLPPSEVYFRTLSERIWESPLAAIPAAAVGAGLILAFIAGLSWVATQLHFAHWLAVGFLGIFGGGVVLVFGAMILDQFKQFKSKYIPPDIKP